jgi:hypothetical protein
VRLNKIKELSIYYQALIIFVLSLAFVITILSSLNIGNKLLANIIIGVVSSLISSTLFYFFFSAIVEEKQKEYSASSAADIAIQYALECLELAPRHVYLQSHTTDSKFDRMFEESFGESNFYYFKGASAGFAIYRLAILNTIHNSMHLESKTIQYLILNPQNKELLHEFARSNLRFTTDGRSPLDQPLINDEIEKIQKDIYMAILVAYRNRQLADIDISFHDEFVFFRSEIFSKGIFISYYNGTKTFPGSAYYTNDSEIYKAYLRNFKYNQIKSHKQFSLKKQSESSKIEDILMNDPLNCKYSIDELEKHKDQRFEEYERKIRK